MSPCLSVGGGGRGKQTGARRVRVGEQTSPKVAWSAPRGSAEFARLVSPSFLSLTQAARVLSSAKKESSKARLAERPASAFPAHLHPPLWGRRHFRRPIGLSSARRRRAKSGRAECKLIIQIRPRQSSAGAKFRLLHFRRHLNASFERRCHFASSGLPRLLGAEQWSRREALWSAILQLFLELCSCLSSTSCFALNSQLSSTTTPTSDVLPGRRSSINHGSKICSAPAQSRCSDFSSASNWRPLLVCAERGKQTYATRQWAKIQGSQANSLGFLLFASH